MKHQRQRIVHANVGEFLIRKTIPEVIKFCEAKGYESEREKDYRMRDYYWQIGEHWKRWKQPD